MKKTAIAAAIMAFCESAFADPVSIITAAASWIGAHQFIATVALMVFTSAYGSAQAKKAQRKAEAEARAKHNEALEDRAITLLTGAPAMRAVYGRCIVGGDIMAVFTTDKTSVDAKGKAYTKTDGYKHVVIRIADHEVDAIHGAYWGGVKVGPLSGIGDPVYTGDSNTPIGQTAATGWATLWTEQRTAIINGDTKLPYKVESLVSAIDTTGANRLSELTVSTSKRRVTGPNTDVRLTYIALRDDFSNEDQVLRSVEVPATATSFTVPNGETATTIVGTSHYVNLGGDNGTDAFPVTVTLSPDGRTFSISTVSVSGSVSITYTITNAATKLKFSFHRGKAGQAADLHLKSIAPTKWTDQHTLDGMAYAVVTFDLEDTRFQGGPTEISFDVSGRRLWDPRTGTRVFSRNNALVANDYLLAPWGLKLQDEDVSESHLIASANVCDTGNVFTVTDTKFGIVTNTTEPLYTFNGLITSDESKEAVLAGIGQSMGGSVIDATQWLITAGAWTAPVRDLTDDDLAGSIEVVQGDNGGQDTFNGVRARYTPAGMTQPAEMTPYSNATLVTADGAPLYDNQDYKYTDSDARCLNLARIHTETSRTGLVIRYPAKTSAWDLEVGDRVRVKSSPADFAFDYKKFRITDWQHTLQAPVLLTLQEDEPESYDTVDTALADPTKDIQIGNPWALDPIEGVVIESGTVHLVTNTSGGVMVRALVTWDEPEGAFMANGQGRVEVWYRSYADGVPEDTWYRSSPAMGVNSVYLDNLKDNQLIEVQLYAVNALGVIGPSIFVSHQVVGRTEPPSDVTGLDSSVTQGVIPWSWEFPPDLDYDTTEVRASDTNWGSHEFPPLWRGRSNSWNESVNYASTFVRYFRHIDTGGRTSVNTATKSQVVNAGDLGPEASNSYRLEVTPPTGVLFTDYRGIVSNFSTANAVVKVINQNGVDVTSSWTLSKTDNEVNTSLSAGDLSVLSFDSPGVDSAFPGALLRVPCIDSSNDISVWKTPRTHYSSTYVSSGGPFTGTGYIQFEGSGGSESRVVYSPNQANLIGFNTNWTMSMWIFLTEYPSFNFTLMENGAREMNLSTASWGTSGATAGVKISGRYFGNRLNSYNNFADVGLGGSGSTIPASECTLNTWHFVEVTWSAAERKLRSFFNGVKREEVAVTNGYDLATYISAAYTSSPTAFHTALGGLIPTGGNTYPFRNGRISDINYSFGGVVNTANYTPPTTPRNGTAYLAQATVDIQAESGGLTLNYEYVISTTPSPKASVQVVPSRNFGVVTADWNDANKVYTQTPVTFVVLVNGVNDSANWDMMVGTNAQTSDLIPTINYATKTVSVNTLNTDSGKVLVYFSNPNYPTQYLEYPINYQKAPKPAQTVTVNRSQIVLEGDYNGVASDFSQAIFQAVMREGGEVASGWSWSESVTSGITYTHSNGVVTITAMSGSVDSGEITLTATKGGWVTTTVRCGVVKTKLKLPAGQVVSAIPPISVVDSAYGSAIAAVKFKTNGEIQTKTGFTASWVTIGVWFNPATGTPGTSYRLFSLGAWYPLSSDVVIEANPNSGSGGNGISAMYDGTYTIAALTSTTPLGIGRLFMWATIESGGA